MHPTILLVPGAWHPSTCFSHLQSHLESLGYPVETVDHPTIGAEPPTATLADDVANVRRTLSRLIDDEAKTVVLMGHSYGGVVISNASEGFALEPRQHRGQKGGLLLVVYLAAFVLPAGKSLYDGLGGKWQPWQMFEGPYAYSSNERHVFYHDVPAALQDEAVASLTHICTAAFMGPVVHEPWRVMPVAYLYCDDDQALPLAVQEQLVQMMVGAAAQVAPPLVLTGHLPASHSPFLSMPGRTAESLVGVIKEVEGRGLN